MISAGAQLGQKLRKAQERRILILIGVSREPATAAGNLEKEASLKPQLKEQAKSSVTRYSPFHMQKPFHLDSRRASRSPYCLGRNTRTCYDTFYSWKKGEKSTSYTFQLWRNSKNFININYLMPRDSTLKTTSPSSAHQHACNHSPLWPPLHLARVD